VRVLVTQDLDPAGLEILRQAGCTVDLRVGDGPIAREELLERVQGCVGLLPMLTERVDAQVLDAGPLRAVSTYSVGTNHIDLDACRARGVAVSHTPGLLTDATADLAWTLLLAAARHVVPADRFMRQGRFLGWHPTLFRGMELRGKTLGIVGWGRIGQATAERAAGFGMDVIHHSRRSGVSLAELLERSDVVSLHCPLTPATRGLIGAAELASMKPGSVLVNTARGPVVDEGALVHALTQGPLMAAGLDVFELEPVVHPGLLELDNVVLLPHLGSATVQARRSMAELAAGDLVAALTRQAQRHPVG
jgi:glyoxylate reductase